MDINKDIYKSIEKNINFSCQLTTQEGRNPPMRVPCMAFPRMVTRDPHQTQLHDNPSLGALALGMWPSSLSYRWDMAQTVGMVFSEPQSERAGARPWPHNAA